jgi:hypothetical protein
MHFFKSTREDSEAALTSNAELARVDKATEYFFQRFQICTPQTVATDIIKMEL